MSKSGREAHPNVWEWSGCPPGCPGVVETASRMAGSDWEAISNVRMYGSVQRPSRMSGSCWYALPYVKNGWEAL